MKNREIWESYDYYTSEITKHARYLGFAGIAICWFFRSPQLVLPRSILAGLFFLVLFFLGDLAQYYTAAMRLRSWMHREEEKKEKEKESIDGEYWPPKNLDKPAFVLFHAKLLALLLGFGLIGYELISWM